MTPFERSHEGSHLSFHSKQDPSVLEPPTILRRLMAKAEAKCISIEALRGGAKGLAHVSVHKASSKDAGEPDSEDLEPMIRLYNRHKGNIPAMFEELGEDSGKAEKYPPKDAEAFAKRYLQGGYTYTAEHK